jgi:septum formation protein
MIILASTSSTRQALVRNAGISFDVFPPHVNERQLVSEHPEWNPEQVSLSLAEEKALSVSRNHAETLVIGADQVLALGTVMYSKPKDQQDCRTQLAALRGQTHRLISSVAVARKGVITWSFSDTALLRMREFTDQFIDYYIEKAGAGILKSVGSYQVEGLGLQLFDTIEGDYFTVLGLPLLPLLSYLRSEKVLMP